jgi:hypothetical protein
MLDPLFSQTGEKDLSLWRWAKSLRWVRKITQTMELVKKVVIDF